MTESNSTASGDQGYQNPYDDPLHLCASDFPGMQLVSTLFNGRNYAHWSKGVLMVLGAKNKQGFLDGKTSMPANSSAKYSQWLRCDNMIRCWIINSIETGIKEGFIYGQSNGPLLYQLKKELRNILQENSSVVEYFNRLKRHWDDIEEIEKCTCSILKQLIEATSREKSYETLRTNILSMELLPTINKAYSFVQPIEKASALLHPELKIGYQNGQYTQKGYGQKFSANAEVHGETPLDQFSGSTQLQAGHKFDPEVVTVVYQKMMDMIQANQGGSVDFASSSINYAGKLVASNAVSCNHNSVMMEWIVDSGATDHMSAQKHLFLNMRPLISPIFVALPDGTLKTVTHIGDVQLHPKILLREVLFIPEFKHNLLSVGKLLSSNGLMIHFDVHKCTIQDHARLVHVIGVKDGGLYKLRHGQHSLNSAEFVSLHSDCRASSSFGTSLDTCSSLQCTASDRCKHHKHVEIFHERLGHTSIAKMSRIPAVKLTDLHDFKCDICVLAKMHRLPFDRDISRSDHAFDLVHIDLWGPYKTLTLTGAHYFLTVLDDNTRTQVSGIVAKFLTMIRSDNGTEIVQQRSVPGVPQQNGRVERKHRHLIETARALRLNASLPKRFWGECLLAATYIINKLPTPILSWKAHVELLLKKPVTFDELRVVGCLCFALMSAIHRDKFDPKARRCIFLGYPYGQKAYKLYDLATHQIFVSRDVVFHEHDFPFKAKAVESTLSLRSHPTFPNQVAAVDDIIAPVGRTSAQSTPSTSVSEHVSAPLSSSDSSVSVFSGPTGDSSPVSASPHISTNAVPLPLRHSTRSRQIPSKFNNFICPTLQQRQQQASDVSASPASFSVFDVSTYPLTLTHSLQAVLFTSEPSTYSQAKDNPH
ncbi:hypothetical protein RND81_12G187800 [Saponaria officinalis]|uniref:Integrase catalytic domain-containing protein n=1 Tax=Saponaria officinalis TaxID=3572 RepID=A0AAW1HCM4_SAPOF